MKGHIRERSPGRWAIILDVPDPTTGKRRRRWHSFAGTKRQAQIECARLINEIQTDSHVDPSRETVTSFLGRWLEHMQGQVSPRTHERYAELVRWNIAPLLGAVALTKLQPPTISRAYSKALTSGRRDGQGGLSPHTVHHMHRVLRQALEQAVTWRMLVRNPADLVKPPKVEREQMQTLDTDETVALIDAARGTDMFMPILLGVLCGLRRGEVGALRWRSVDLEAGTLAVVASTEQTEKGIREKETKSGKGRSVVLPALLMEELRAHRLKQAQVLLQLGIRLTGDHHVVARADGQPLQPRSMTHAFVKFMRRHGLRKIRLHDLRHSHATHMLAAGVHPKIAQERSAIRA
jgi:integrase